MKNFKGTPTYLSRWPSVERAVAGERPGHAWLITGQPKSVEALGTAFCRQLLCEETAESGCRCRSCRQALTDHPDFKEVRPEPKSIKRDSVAQAVASLLYAPLWSPRKVVWIGQADTLTPASENFLLKHLEEPLPYVVFLLTADDADGLLATVRSRCRQFAAAPDPDQDTSVFSPAALWAPNGLTPDTVAAAAAWVRARYRAEGAAALLDLWDTLWELHQYLEANGNSDIARAALREAWVTAGLE